ncbi:hypothetical protein PM082_022234 [Marasmius tenuissimus]|nr:hypothetical protein PM082_022234 [Marasmius tenuissimus]
MLMEHRNGMFSIHYPLPGSLFYWSFDPNGKHAISEEDWETYGIPRLKVLSWIGSSWYSSDYRAVGEYLQTRNYGLDGRIYAWERGYPALVPDTVPRPRIRPKTNPRIIRYIQIIKTTGKSSRGLMRSTGRSRPGSSGLPNRVQPNGSRTRRRS